MISEALAMSANEDRSLPENPYAVPQANVGGLSISVLSESAERRHLRTFVGSKADYYLQKWGPSAGHEGGSAGFNWAAFLLAGVWLGYRKMYLVAMIFWSIIVAETIAEEVLFVGVLGREEAPAVLGPVVSLVAAILCGSYGNRWYASHARKVIADVRARGLEEQAVAEMLARRGGTSLGAALGFLLLFVAGGFAVAGVLELLS